MEDVDAVVPLRPGFDIQLRGFHRTQVLEHIAVLEDQLRLVTLDRNEAVRLNDDLRTLYDDTRRSLDQAEQRLQRIESSDTGLPAASQRVQNMLAIAEEEVQTLRDTAKRQADIIRGAAETEARDLLGSAEGQAAEIRSECSSLVTDIEARRDALRRDHEQSVSEMRAREQRLRQSIRDEYKKVVSAAQEEADELVARTREQCGQWNAESEQLRLEVLEELRVQQARLEELRRSVLTAMDGARQVLDDSTSELRTSTTGQAALPAAVLPVPEQREGVRTFTITLDAHPEGTGVPPATPDPARQN